MNFRYYKETQLEQLITELYLTNGPGIHYPEQLQSFDLLSRSFDIEVVIYRGRPFTDKIARVVFLNEKHGHFLNRMSFFHEAGHIVRHEGDQRKMPKLFKDAQEAEAEAFALYAAIPFYLLCQLDLPPQRGEAIEYIARIFQVPLKFAEKRIDQIQRRILQAQFDEAASHYYSTQCSDTTEQMTVEGTRIYSYYDSSADISGPSQLVIEADDVSVESAIDFLFPVDGPFDRLDLEDLQNYKRCKRLYAQDLIYKDGMIGVNFAVLNLKYGRNQQYVMHMQDIEQFLRIERGF